MYRILLVDNEPIILDGLYHLFLEIEHLELDIYKAYSSSEALKQLSKNRMDIAFLDIQMPGMNGLELQKSIIEQWPWCKIIFLTGFNDSNYMQSAIRSGVVDYVLKTEGDERILETLDKAVEQIKKESVNERFIVQAKQELSLARPMLQKEFISEYLYGERGYQESMEHKLLELHIPLTITQPLYQILGRVDEWPASINHAEKTLMLYAINNIIQEYLSSLNMYGLAYDKMHFVCLLQPKALNPGAAADVKVEWESSLSYVNGMLDSIQNTCKQLLKLPISLMSLGMPSAWQDVSRDFNHLRREMGKGLGLGQEVILTALAANQLSERSNRALRSNTHPYKLLESYLDSGNEQDFSELCTTMLQNAYGSVEHYPNYMEVYYGIANLLLAALNRRELSATLYDSRQLDKLMQVDAHITWRAAAEYIIGLAKQMLQSAREDQKGESNAITDRINAYIGEHLQDDLSLNKLSEVVFLNPAYLSRLYKQTVGLGLAEYISNQRMEKALDLLRGTSLKIQAIAGEIGLETGYFIKMFKKYMKLTPQEYRESLGK